MRALSALFFVVGLTLPAIAEPQTSAPEMYREWCAVCHGEDGRGRPKARPVPTVLLDFTDCRRSTPETDADWTLVITHGGTAAGRSSDMPGFEMLPPESVAKMLAHVRSFCADRRWPSGNLNFPRSSIATKAFPEDEFVLQAMLSDGADTNARGRLEASYARRVGRRGQVEIKLPAETVAFVGRRNYGIGDVSLEGKYVAHANAAGDRIFSFGLEASLGTGSLRWAFGEGTPVFEPFVAAGFSTGPWFVQADFRGLLPAKRFSTEPIHYTAYGASVLRPLSTSPTGWTVGVAATGVDRSLAIAPEILKGLTRTGSLSVGGAVELSVQPVFPAARGLTRWSTYLLWDYLEPLRSRP